jgi:hypothetical protein
MEKTNTKHIDERLNELFGIAPKKEETEYSKEVINRILNICLSNLDMDNRFVITIPSYIQSLMPKKLKELEVFIFYDYLKQNPIEKIYHRRNTSYSVYYKEVFVHWLKKHIELTKKP